MVHVGERLVQLVELVLPGEAAEWEPAADDELDEPGDEHFGSASPIVTPLTDFPGRMPWKSTGISVPGGGAPHVTK